MRLVPRTAHGSSVVLRLWKKKNTDAKWALLLSVRTKSWAHKSWTRADGRVGSNWTLG